MLPHQHENFLKNPQKQLLKQLVIKTLKCQVCNIICEFFMFSNSDFFYLVLELRHSARVVEKLCF